MKSGYFWLIGGLMLIGAGLVWATVVKNIVPPTLPVTSGVPNTATVKDSPTQATATLPPIASKQYVPILMYHYIRDYQNASDPLGIQLSVAPATLDHQLDLLKKAGYETISLEDFASQKFKPKSIVLTFDDGYDDHFTSALPILQKYSDTATFFIISGSIGHSGYMNLDQIAQLKAAGMEIGGHTITHLNLANASYEKAIEEISTSMRDRDPVFAYPSGQYKPETLDVVSGLGIKVAVTTNLGVATDKSSLYELPRIRVKEQTDLLKVINDQTAIAKRQR